MNKKLIADNEKIDKTGKSEYTFEQRTLISTQLCAMGNIDAALGTLMNILDLRYRIGKLPKQKRCGRHGNPAD